MGFKGFLFLPQAAHFSHGMFARQELQVLAEAAKVLKGAAEAGASLGSVCMCKWAPVSGRSLMSQSQANAS